MHSQALNACFRNIFAPRRVNRELRGQSCGGEGGALRPARGCSGGSRPLERSCSGHIFPPCCASSNHAPHTQRSSPSCYPAAVSVFLYALLTVLFTLAGLAYIVLPQLTLKWTFG